MTKKWQGIMMLSLVLALIVMTMGVGCKAPEPAPAPAPPPAPAPAPAEKTAQEIYGGPYTWNVGHNSRPDTKRDQVMHLFADLVNEKSDGQVTIKVYPSGQLGDIMEMFTGVARGTHQMYYGRPLPTFDPRMNYVTLPYMVSSVEEMKIAHFPGGLHWDLLSQMYESIDMKMLGIGNLGWLGFANNVRPIRKPEDLAGLKMRGFPGAEPLNDYIKEMGAEMTVVPFKELYTALQTGLVQGQYNPLFDVQNNFADVQPYYTQAGMSNEQSVLGFNLELFESLTPELQDVLVKSGQEAAMWDVETQVEVDKEQKAIAESKGMEVIILTAEEIEPFRQIGLKCWERWEDDYGLWLMNKVHAFAGLPTK